MGNSRGMVGRIVVFDLIRAVACMFVLFGHLMVDVHHVHSVWLPHGYGVGMFFFISGYLILQALTRQSAIYFLVGRVVRLLPTLLFSIAVFSLYDTIKHGRDNAVANLIQGIFFVGDYFRNYNIAGIDTWSLNVEWRFYMIALLSYIAFPIHKIKRVVPFFLCFCLLTVCVSLLTFYLNADFAVFSAPYQNNAKILLLMLGMLFFLHQNKDIGYVMVFFFGSVVLFVFCMLQYFGVGVVSLEVVSGIVIAIGMAMGLRHVVWSKKQAQIIAYLAHVSYPLYVCHHFFLNKLGYGFIPASFLFAHLVSKYIEQPSITWGKRVMKKYKNNAGLSVER